MVTLIIDVLINARLIGALLTAYWHAPTVNSLHRGGLLTGGHWFTSSHRQYL